MYIKDRLFSENTDEVLYSVLMDEDEYSLYSEFQKEFGLAQKVGEAVKKKLSKIGNKLKNRKAIAEAKEEIPEAVEKIKPKKVKRINKELKRKKLLEAIPTRENAGEFDKVLRDFELRTARGISRQNPTKLSKADFAVIKNQAEKSSRFKNGLYVKDTNPAKEEFRRQHLKELRDSGAFNSRFNNEIKFANERERLRHMDVAETGAWGTDAGIGHTRWLDKNPFIEY